MNTANEIQILPNHEKISGLVIKPDNKSFVKKLPIDLLRIIAEYAGYKSFINLRMVSKYFSSEIFKLIEFSTFSESNDKSIESIKIDNNRLIRWMSENMKITDNLIIRYFQKNGNLTCLKIIYLSLIEKRTILETLYYQPNKPDDFINYRMWSCKKLSMVLRHIT